MIRTVFGSNKSGTALIPIFDTSNFQMGISTYNGNFIVNHLDGTIENVAPVKRYDTIAGSFFLNISKNYTSPYSGNTEIKFLNGLNDVYSLFATSNQDSSVFKKLKLNIQNWGVFIRQFPRLNNYRLFFYAYNTPDRYAIIKGDLSDMPDSVESILLEQMNIDPTSNLEFNLNNLSVNSKLKYFMYGSQAWSYVVKISGDLSRLPASTNYFLVANTGGGLITYTAGKVWASSFDTLSIPLSLGNFLEADALFTDMGNSITSAIGGKIISIGGWFSGTSKLIYLKSLGFAISGLDTSTGTASSTTQKLIGDIAQIPSDVTFFKILQCATGSAIAYTAGKVWASSFDTLYLPILLTRTETDNLFIDANNSVTTAIGSKSWTLEGFRTSVSDVAVAGLIAKGFTVNCFRLTDVLTMPLSSNLLDSSTYANHATMVGTETHSLGGLLTSTGNYAYIPNKTSLDFGTGSLRFGCTVKFNSITGSFIGIIGKTVYAGAVGRYGIYLDGGNISSMVQLTAGTFTNATSASPYNDGNFHTIEVICNRTTGKQTLTIDGILVNTQTFTPSSDNLSRNARFMIGGYGNATGTGLNPSSEFNGIIKDVFVNKF